MKRSPIIKITYGIIFLVALMSCSGNSNEINTEEHEKKGQDEILLGMTLGKPYYKQLDIAKENGLVMYDWPAADVLFYYIPIEGMHAYVDFNILNRNDYGGNWSSIDALKEFKNTQHILGSIEVTYAVDSLVDTNYYLKSGVESTLGRIGDQKITKEEYDKYYKNARKKHDEDNDKKLKAAIKENGDDWLVTPDWVKENRTPFVSPVYVKVDFRCDSTAFFDIAELFEMKYGKTEPWESADKSGDYAVDLEETHPNQPLRKRWELGQTRIELSLDFLYSKMDKNHKPIYTAWTVKARYTFTNDIWNEIGQIQQIKKIDREFEEMDKKLKKI